MKFKIIMGVLLMALTIILFSGCSATIHNPLADEESYVYESEDKEFRLEVATLGYGRLYISFYSSFYFLPIEYQVTKGQVKVFISSSESLEDQFILDVSFGLSAFSVINYDTMYLKGPHYEEDEVLSDLDITLYRTYEEVVKPYNYIDSIFKSDEYNIVLYNNDLTYYTDNLMMGTMGDIDICMMILNIWFYIKNSETEETIVSGEISFDGMNLILTPSPMYTEFPNEITLVYSKYIS